MKKPIDTLMNKEITRQEFLTLMGFGLLSLTGFSRIIYLLTGKHNHLQRESSAYGSSPYGGSR